MPIEIITRDADGRYREAATRAAQCLQRGQLVIFPTETVYGLAAALKPAGAISQLRAAKRSPDRRPFTVHLARRSDAARYVRLAPVLARRLARKAWPGPLTLVLHEPAPEQTEVARQVGAESLSEIYFEHLVGLRCPDHPATTEVLELVDSPVVASSANLAGNPPPHTLSDALAALGQEEARIGCAIDGDRTRFNAASTVVRIDESGWRVERQGVLDERAIARMARSETLFVCTGNSCRSPMAEAMFRDALARHLNLTEGQLDQAGYSVASAGTFAAPGRPASPETIAELSRRGLDGSSHRSQPATPELLHRAERIYCMTGDHRADLLALAPSAAGKVFLVNPAGDISDPIGCGPEAYRRCAEQLNVAVQRIAQELADEDRNW